MRQIFLILLLFTLIIASACGGGPPQPKPAAAPAKVALPVVESWSLADEVNADEAKTLEKWQGKRLIVTNLIYDSYWDEDQKIDNFIWNPTSKTVGYHTPSTLKGEKINHIDEDFFVSCFLSDTTEVTGLTECSTHTETTAEVEVVVADFATVIKVEGTFTAIEGNVVVLKDCKILK
jgi:hypothetical protein